jgi:carboxyl-terminal processing protease
MKNIAGVIFRSLILIAFGIAIGVYLNFNISGGSGITTGDKLSRAVSLIKSNYVDTLNVDSLEGATANALLQKLDPHSLYLPPQQAKSINDRLEGNFSGIGLEYTILRDTFIIAQVYPKGPAAQAGLIPGDKIIEVDKKKFTGPHLIPDSVSKALRGEDGSEVLLTVIPAKQKIIKKITVIRGKVELSSLDAAYLAAPGTGYIKISKFAATTDKDFRAAFFKLKAKGMQKLILDLRDNGGGYLTTATELADEFLKKDKLIMFTKGAHEERRDYFSTDSGVFQEGKLAVLINEYSASASEILAGALQDLDRAVIVGRRSFGKGLVQQQFPFDDGSAINLTVARYYTPSGRSIQKSYKEGTETYHNEINERVRKGELISAENNLNDSAFKKSANYVTAKGKKVFAGGGIMPDVFVPADTLVSAQLLRELNNQQVFTGFVIDKLQTELAKYSSLDDFLKKFNISNDTTDNFILYASTKLKEMDSREILLSKEAIKTQIKANAAWFKWGYNAYYEALNNNDPVLKKAVEALN